MEQNLNTQTGGTWLKELRQEWQITLNELAEQVGASAEWIAQLEKGEGNIAASLFAGFARSFDMTVADFAAAYNSRFGAASQQAA